MNYYELLGLQKEPFSTTPDPYFFYRSPQHQEALEPALSICPSVCNELGGRDVFSVLICRPLRGLLLEPARMLLIAR